MNRDLIAFPARAQPGAAPSATLDDHAQATGTPVQGEREIGAREEWIEIRVLGIGALDEQELTRLDVRRDLGQLEMHEPESVTEALSRGYSSSFGDERHGPATCGAGRIR
jgi:hypothetical protein